jgi:dTDP-4-dehydrorhamnose 3,5-epimerase
MPLMVITPTRFEDSRGWFSETWNKLRLVDLGIDLDFVQDNHSLSVPVGTIRGLHYQRPPNAQAKLVRCIKGRIFDVAVDIRHKSPTFKKWFGVELSAELGNQLFIPAGFAHGFMTLEANCEIAYKVDSYYSPDSDGGIIWNDPELAIKWPLADLEPLLSAKDATLPSLEQADFEFHYDGAPLHPIFSKE